MKPLHTMTVLAVACLLTSLASSAVFARPASRAESQNNLKQIGLASQAARMECQNNLKQLGLGAQAARSECSNNLKQMTTAARASQADLNRLKKLTTKPSVKCGKIEYVYQCISGQTMFLKSAGCRRGETEASCCRRARQGVSKFCGRIWALAKKSGKTWSPGIFTCKCIETPKTLKRLPERRIRRR